MIAATLKDQLLGEIERLSPEQMARVYGYTQALTASRPQGVPSRSLLKYAGTLDAESARAMREAIEGAFEQVDPREW